MVLWRLHSAGFSEWSMRRRDGDGGLRWREAGSKTNAPIRRRNRQMQIVTCASDSREFPARNCPARYTYIYAAQALERRPRGRSSVDTPG